MENDELKQKTEIDIFHNLIFDMMEYKSKLLTCGFGNHFAVIIYYI